MAAFTEEKMNDVMLANAAMALRSKTTKGGGLMHVEEIARAIRCLMKGKKGKKL